MSGRDHRVVCRRNVSSGHVLVSDTWRCLFWAGAMTPLVEMGGMTKHYGVVRAVHEVDLEIGLGEIVAIVGDNGAGKSTLVKMLSGAVVPDRGEIRVDGAPRRIREPNDARALGIETIYQDLALL